LSATFIPSTKSSYDIAYLVEVLALELGEESRDALAIDIDTDGLDDLGDVGLRWAGVTTEGEEKVCCEILHFECLSGMLGSVAQKTCKRKGKSY